jgi:hypothetical protein
MAQTQEPTVVGKDHHSTIEEATVKYSKKKPPGTQSPTEKRRPLTRKVKDKKNDEAQTQSLLTSENLALLGSEPDLLLKDQHTTDPSTSESSNY